MTPEERQRLDTWAAEWRLAGLRSTAETSWGDLCIAIDMTGWTLAIKELPSTGGWAVWNPTEYSVTRGDMFFDTLEEALDNASARLRRLL